MIELNIDELDRKLMITESDFKMAHEVANKIIDFYDKHKEEYNDFISKMFKKLSYAQKLIDIY